MSISYERPVVLADFLTLDFRGALIVFSDASKGASDIFVTVLKMYVVTYMSNFICRQSQSIQSLNDSRSGRVLVEKP